MAWTIASPRVKDYLAPVMLRRRRAEVLPDLPEKTYATLDCELEQDDLAACAIELRDGESAAALYARLSKPAEFSVISGLMERLSTAKVPALLRHVEAFEEAGEPLVVFSPHRRPIEALGRRKGWLTILGDDPPDERARKVALFQAGGYLGIAGTTGAMGTSVTLTRASKVLFCGRPWNPEAGRQCEDRVCRIGQDRGVTVYDLVSAHALDTRLLDVLRGKDALIESVLGARSWPHGREPVRLP
jgi:SNF2 family DNA or RNA helicase